MKNQRCIVKGVLLAMLLSHGAVAASKIDPTNSPMWEYLRQQYIPDQEYKFDERITINTPMFAENATQVPITIDARSIDHIEKILLLADIRPFQKVLEFEPGELAPILPFNMKVQQATAVRALVRTKDKIWHVGSAMIDASGGGCSAPSIGLADPAWQDNLGQISARWFSQSQRLKLHIVHPQDTGLANGIPAFFLNQLHITQKNGDTMASFKLYEPISENPMLSLQSQLPPKQIQLNFRDNNGNEFNKMVMP